MAARSALRRSGSPCSRFLICFCMPCARCLRSPLSQVSSCAACARSTFTSLPSECRGIIPVVASALLANPISSSLRCTSRSRTGPAARRICFSGRRHRLGRLLHCGRPWRGLRAAWPQALPAAGESRFEPDAPLRIRVLDALRCSGVEVSESGSNCAKGSSAAIGARLVSCYLRTARLASHVESLRSFPRGASREYF